MELKDIASLLVEFDRLKKANPNQDSPEFRRLTRVGDILHEVTLTADQVSDLGEYGYSLITDDHVKSSCSYTELKEEHERLGLRYDGLNNRYKALVREVEKMFHAPITPDVFFGLQKLIEKHTEESIRESR